MEPLDARELAGAGPDPSATDRAEGGLEPYIEVAKALRAVAHELNNALSMLGGWTQVLRDRMPDGSAARDVLPILEGSIRSVTELSHRLSVFGRTPAKATAPVDLNSLLRSAVEATARDRVPITLSLAPELPLVLADETALEPAVRFALEAFQDGEERASRIDVCTLNLDLPSVEITERGMTLDQRTIDALLKPERTFGLLPFRRALAYPTLFRLMSIFGGRFDLRRSGERDLVTSFSLPVYAVAPPPARRRLL